jgi:hypothetical protein
LREKQKQDMQEQLDGLARSAWKLHLTKPKTHASKKGRAAK